MTSGRAGMTVIERIHVVVAHDDPLLAAGVCVIIDQAQGFDVTYAGSQTMTADHMHALCVKADVFAADYDTAMSVLSQLQNLRARVLILTSRQSATQVVCAIEAGAKGYWLTGCSAPELLSALRIVANGGTSWAPIAAERIADRLRYRSLTGREQAVLDALTDGLSNKAIAKRLNIAEGTVKSHVKAILGKLSASCRTEAIAIARRRGLIYELDSRTARV